MTEELKEMSMKSKKRKASEDLGGGEMEKKESMGTALHFPDDINNNNFETGSIDSPKKSRIVIFVFNLFRKSLLKICLDLKDR